MATTFGKLEGRITIPTGGWSISIAETGGGGATASASFTAGDTYYLSSIDSESNDFPADLAAKLTASAGNATYACSIAAGENGTGKVTITASGGSVTSIAITWTSSAMKDLLGFTGTQSGSLSYTGANQARSLWLPNGPFQALNGGGSWAGWIESDLRAQESPAGHCFALTGQRKKASSISWVGISRAKIWTANESTTNESLEKFYTDVVLAEAAWSGRAAGPIRWYSDAATDSTYVTYSVPTWNVYRPDQLREQWTGQWIVSIPRLVEVPT